MSPGKGLWEMESWVNSKSQGWSAHWWNSWALQLVIVTNKLLICFLLIVSKVVVMFRYWVGLGMYNIFIQNMCFKY